MKTSVMLYLALALTAHTLPAQSEFFRFKSAFSIKEKEGSNEQGRLITGSVYYDKNLHKTVYDIQFPEPEQWMVRDTIMYLIRADTLVSRQIVPPVGEFSLFNMILSQQLSDFGLAKVGYTPGEIQQDGNQVIARWIPPEQFKPYAGPVVLAQENKHLNAAAFYDTADKLVSKFYFKDYTVQNGFAIPGKVYQIFYRTTGEFVRIMSLKNVLINQSDEDSMYDFAIPAGG